MNLISYGYSLLLLPVVTTHHFECVQVYTHPNKTAIFGITRTLRAIFSYRLTFVRGRQRSLKFISSSINHITFNTSAVLSSTVIFSPHFSIVITEFMKFLFFEIRYPLPFSFPSFFMVRILVHKSIENFLI